MELGHILDSNQTREVLDKILGNTACIKDFFRARIDILRETLKGKLIVLLFNQPSTRTRTRFELAGRYLGADVIVFNEMVSTSAAKGESWRNTIRTLARFGADIIVVRHPRNHAPHEAAAFCDQHGFKTKIINAGDGNNFHPTQAFLDLFAIKENFPEKFGKRPLEIAVGADLKNARAIHSLVDGLAQYPVKLTLISWANHSLPWQYLQPLMGKRDFREVVGFPPGKRFDVVYWIRFQAEHAPQESREELMERYNQEFGLNSISLGMLLKDRGIFMQPGPRGGEIDDEIDSDPRVKDGDQVENGLYSSMALYLMMLPNALIRGKND